MLAKFKRFLHRRKLALLDEELARVRALRMDLTKKEFALRGRRALLEASA